MPHAGSTDRLCNGSQTHCGEVTILGQIHIWVHEDLLTLELVSMSEALVSGGRAGDVGGLRLWLLLPRDPPVTSQGTLVRDPPGATGVELG